MAAKVRGKPFPKGKSGNPRGSSSRKRDLAKIARLTNAQIEQVGAAVLLGDTAQLQELARSQDSCVLQVWVASLVLNSLDKGCPQTFRILMERLCGKPRETVELSGKDGGPLSMEIASREMTEDEMRQRADNLARQRAEAGDD